MLNAVLALEVEDRPNRRAGLGFYTRDWISLERVSSEIKFREQNPVVSGREGR